MHGTCVGVKTITIDLEAYKLLLRQKRPAQSFSEVIKQRFATTTTAADLLRHAATVRMSPEALGAVDELVARRRRDLAKASKL